MIIIWVVKVKSKKKMSDNERPRRDAERKPALSKKRSRSPVRALVPPLARRRARSPAEFEMEWGRSSVGFGVGALGDGAFAAGAFGSPRRSRSPEAAPCAQAKYPSASSAAQCLDSPGASLGPRNCVICLETPARYVLVPCGHLVLCGRCVLETGPGRRVRDCPVCREVIHQVMRVFY